MENYPEKIETIFEFKVAKGQMPERLDIFLSNSIKNATRNKVQRAIEEGCVIVNGKPAKSSRKIQALDEIVCRILKAPPIDLVPENIPLDIVFEDEYLIVINKPPGIVAHPGFGNPYGTIVNAVLYHLGMREPIKIEIDDDDENQDEGLLFSSEAIRPGLVHRLDKDTSGLMLISKNPEVHAKLAQQFQDRTVEKVYYALVWGTFKEDKGRIEGDIGRSQSNRKLFAVLKKGGKPAITEYEVIENFEYISLLRVKLLTGRTHQIRVHFSHNHHPVFGDVSYKGDSVVFGGNNHSFKKIADSGLESINRQMLHAKELSFTHPEFGKRLNFSIKLPDDFEKVLKLFKKYMEN
ncbi:MAG: RluA family pseudouridine synthase [Bacteroidetes bacterium]|nr:MAG: RluA family pseudouridine synthase [Bacteroidota bacterium]